MTDITRWLSNRKHFRLLVHRNERIDLTELFEKNKNLKGSMKYEIGGETWKALGSSRNKLISERHMLSITAFWSVLGL